ncbi:MAG: hypothetical protein IPM02_27405 [Betaproteobacteria bacterium]|nr:hypothetical protein [Betaproteobacteria bacterium]
MPATSAFGANGLKTALSAPGTHHRPSHAGIDGQPSNTRRALSTPPSAICKASAASATPNATPPRSRRNSGPPPASDQSRPNNNIPPSMLPSTTAGRSDGVYRPSQARNAVSASAASATPLAPAPRNLSHPASTMPSSRMPTALAAIRCIPRATAMGVLSAAGGCCCSTAAAACRA